ncbi:MAG: hypothetical protein U7123_12950 [Potamolinea sp.]
MFKIVIVVDALITETAKTPTKLMVDATSKAIAASPIALHSPTAVTVEVITSDLVESLSLKTQDIIWCPLTLDVPETLEFPGKAIFQACNQVTSLRGRVQQIGYPTADSHQCQSDLYLPVVLTAKGPLYGEVIGKGKTNQVYQQPVNLPDKQRQPLYHLAYELLQSLLAPPAVYLLQFAFQDESIIFDRLLPFPAEAAIASLGIQEPDLFTCHWLCLTEQPIFDLTIIAKSDKEEK